MHALLNGMWLLLCIGALVAHGWRFFKHNESQNATMQLAVTWRAGSATGTVNVDARQVHMATQSYICAHLHGWCKLYNERVAVQTWIEHVYWPPHINVPTMNAVVVALHRLGYNISDSVVLP